MKNILPLAAGFLLFFAVSYAAVRIVGSIFIKQTEPMVYFGPQPR